MKKIFVLLFLSITLITSQVYGTITKTEIADSIKGTVFREIRDLSLWEKHESKINTRAERLAQEIYQKVQACDWGKTLRSALSSDLTCIFAKLGYVDVEAYVHDHFSDLLPAE
jgi:hypothetical protein